MKKEIKTYKVVCDMCDVELHNDSIRRNDGTYQETYCSKDDIDLCFNCAGKLFDINIKNKLNQDKIKEFINDYKEKQYSTITGFSSDIKNFVDLPIDKSKDKEIDAYFAKESKKDNNSITLEDL